VCGICGFVIERRPTTDPQAILRAMNTSLTHRGPEDEGIYAGTPAFLGHRRLKIIDLEGGRQPMPNEDGSVVVVFNGEIYNFAELRLTLEEKGHVFRTRSDTEVLVHLWEEVGPDLPGYLNGMFAFAIWDARQQTLFIARDRMGQKPLYYLCAPEAFVFASELKALMLHPAVKKEVDPLSVSKYLMFDCVPSPHTILKNVRKLEPGTTIEYRQGTAVIRRYWDISFPDAHTKGPTFHEAQEEFKSLFSASVQRRLVADVPLGVFLSGGIDSSLVAATMCDLVGAKRVSTFSIGFDDSSFDESTYARTVAQHLGTKHHEKTLKPATMLELLPAILAKLDEPMADASLIPTYFLSAFARESVTVALGGDGGDELALGYPTFQAHKIARWYRFLPGFLQAMVRRIVASLPVSTANISTDYKARQFVAGMEYDRFARHFVWIGSLPPEAQFPLLSRDLPLPSRDLVFEDVGRHLMRCNGRDDFDRLTYLYSKIYMADDILTKVDRASMMHALEVRSPFLDYHVVDFLTSLPTSYKLRGFRSKALLKSAYRTRLPKEILHRKKKGFGIPVARWLVGDLRPWVEELISPDNLDRHNLFQSREVASLWQEHLTGAKDNRKALWSLLVLTLWLRENL
jgi:asparagine synthase (glutamine-hydrolysing)